MHLAILTTGRQDWGILASTYRLLKPSVIKWANPGGSALSQCSDAIEKIGRDLEQLRPDALMLVGDRYETLQGALAATLLKIPLIHLHGGERTLGAFDDQLRDAISKLSHLHLTSSLEHSEELVRQGEMREVVHTVGAPGTDNAFRTDLLTLGELERLIGHKLRQPIHLYVVHPETLSGVDVVSQVIQHKRDQESLCPTPIAILPNHDPGSMEVRSRMKDAFPIAIESLTEVQYWSLLKHTALMVGNSSSIVVEAPALGLNTLLLGERQAGRSSPIPADGKCAERIRDVLASWTPPSPPRKRRVPLAV